MKNLPVFLLLVLFWSCGNDTPQANTADILPNTPETVTRAWQEYVDKDEFDQAAKLSTPNAKEWLLMIEKFLEGLPMEEEEASIVMTQFVEMNCVEQGSLARCGCIIKEEGELIPDTFLLQKIAGQWMVDVPEEVSEDSEENMDAFIDSLLQK